MRYLILIYGSEQHWSALPPEAVSAYMRQFESYTQEMIDSGVMRGGEELQPSFTATTVRMRDGVAYNTDGPFAETKEQLGGFYHIEVESLDDALRWAAKCPGAPLGSIEVRPVVMHG